MKLINKKTGDAIVRHLAHLDRPVASGQRSNTSHWHDTRFARYCFWCFNPAR